MYLIETKRLILRPFFKTDWVDLYDYLSKDEVVKFEPYGILNKSECKEEAIKRSEREEFLAVCLKSNNKLIGNLYFKNININYMTWELGYVFNPFYHNNGYATEACKEIIKHAFLNLDAHRIVANCNVLNISSWNLLERLNLRREGEFKKKSYFKKDCYRKPIWNDVYQYSILKEDWINNNFKTLL